MMSSLDMWITTQKGGIMRSVHLSEDIKILYYFIKVPESITPATLLFMLIYIGIEVIAINQFE
jgi:hypothetical protein